MVDPSPLIFDDLRSRRGRPAFFPDFYDRELELLPLHQDPESGEEHYLARYPKGLKARWHRHSAAHTMIILEGQMEADGRVVGPPSHTVTSQAVSPCTMPRMEIRTASSPSSSTVPSTWRRWTHRSIPHPARDRRQIHSRPKLGLPGPIAMAYRAPQSPPHQAGDRRGQFGPVSRR